PVVLHRIMTILPTIRAKLRSIQPTWLWQYRRTQNVRRDMRRFYDQNTSAIREALGTAADARIRLVADTFSVDDPDKGIESIELPCSSFPLQFRRNSSDFMVIVQIFVNRQY